jgi:hypothetical protein
MQCPAEGSSTSEAIYLNQSGGLWRVSILKLYSQIMVLAILIQKFSNLFQEVVGLLGVEKHVAHFHVFLFVLLQHDSFLSFSNVEVSKLHSATRKEVRNGL